MIFLGESLRAVLGDLNEFIEDSAVIAATAYVCARGSVLHGVFRDKRTLAETLRLGLIFGAIAATEVLFPEERYPFMTDTLTTAFVTYMAGPLMGLVCAVVVTLAAFAFEPSLAACFRTVDVMAVVAVAGAVDRKSVV